MHLLGISLSLSFWFCLFVGSLGEENQAQQPESCSLWIPWIPSLRKLVLAAFPWSTIHPTKPRESAQGTGFWLLGLIFLPLCSGFKDVNVTW